MQAQNISTNYQQSVGNAMATDKKKWKIAQDFEAMFVHQMLKSMRKTVHSEDASHAREIFTEMLDEELAGHISKVSSMGLTKKIYEDLGGGYGTAAEVRALQNYGRQALAPKASTEEIQKWVKEAAQAFDLDQNLLSALISQESGGNSLARSAKGAMGLTQLMPLTAQEMGVQNPWDGRENILGGARYLKQMLLRFDGDEALALAAYNAGPGAVERHDGIPNYKETQDYVQNVLANRSLIRNTEVQNVH
ncbi:MAG: transglycosylase SLT domain-containing protein [Fibrobacter sp.]|nr:transglycosylase SLT domain-containing protein [Fibrobacter sp.]